MLPESLYEDVVRVGCSRAANSELIFELLFRSYCLPLILYATETLDLSKRVISMLDNCINRAVAKIISVGDRQSIQYIRLNLNLLNVEVIIESRKKKLIDKLSSVVFLLSWVLFIIHYFM